MNIALASRSRDREVAVVRQPRVVERFHHGRTPVDLAWLAPPAILALGLFSTWDEGATLVRRGERVRHVDVLVEGEVAEIVAGLVIHCRAPGTLLGADAVLDGCMSTSTIRTRSQVLVVTVPVPALRSVAGSPEMSFWLGDQRTERDRAIQRADVSRAVAEAGEGEPGAAVLRWGS